MSTPQLRPLGIGEILDVAIKVYAKNARTLITIGVIVGVPFELLNGVVKLSTTSSTGDLGSSFSFDPGTMAPDPSRARIAGAVVSVVIGLVIGLLATAATVNAVSDAYLGHVPSARRSLRFALRRARSVLWLWVLLGVGLTLAALFLVIPAIWLYVAWAVATPVLLIEDVRGTAALRRSFRLVRGRWWPTAGLLVVSSIIVSLATFVLGGLLTAIPLAIDGSSVLLAVIASTISSSIVAALVHPLRGAITTILYFDLRVRKEAFDLTLLAAGLGLPEPDLAAWPAGSLAPSLGSGGGEAPPYWPPPPGWKPSAPMQAPAPPRPGWTPSAAMPAPGPATPGAATAPEAAPDPATAAEAAPEAAPGAAPERATETTTEATTKATGGQEPETTGGESPPIWPPPPGRSTPGPRPEPAPE